MRKPMRLAAGVFVVALSVSSALTSVNGSAIAGNQKASRDSRPAGTPVQTKTDAKANGWRLGAPVSIRNLTIFPVIDDNAAASHGFITLDEGLKSGKVTINEMGEDGTVRGGRNRGGSADVNRLAITNKSGKTLVLIAGELLLGGKQDRIVGHDCIVEASNIPVPIEVFCVEHGRWSERSDFGRSRNRQTDFRAGAAGGIGAGSGSGVGPGFGPASGGMAAPSIREKAQVEKSQTEVWSSVSEMVTVNAAKTDTGTLNSVYENQRVKAKVAPYRRALRDRLSDKNVVGVVAAVGGEIIAADVFATHSLLEAYWPKLLNSYVVEAVSRPAKDSPMPGFAAARTYLTPAAGSASSNVRDGVYKLVERKSGEDASFELFHTLDARSTLVHFNRVAKD
jgi:ARG and Rhodanese-Phosphatase-superfamily-associated Protein domain